MNDLHLRQELDRVTQRYRMVLRRSALAVAWLVLALAALAALRWLRAEDHQPPLIAAIVVSCLAFFCAPLYLLALRRTRDPLWLARRIESRFPDLDARLLAALEQQAPDSAGMGFLQQTVIDQAVIHARRTEWARIVPNSGLRMARLASWGLFLAFAAVMVGVGVELRNGFGKTKAGMMQAARLEDFDIKVEPADTSLERNTALLVLARFGNSRLPGEVELLYKDADGKEQQLPMSKSLDDPLFAGRVSPVKRDLTYAVRYGSAQTQWYKVSVFDYPELRKADAQLKFPQYTGMAEKLVEDTRSVTAVEGTKATLTFQLNKPVTEARLVPTKRASDPADAPKADPIALTPDPADPTRYTTALDLKQSQLYTLQLVDSDRRANRDQAQLAINVTPNRPAELKLQWPGRDLDVSPLEEVTVRAQVYDDFGVKRVGLTYSMAGQEPKDVVLAENIAGKDRKEVSQVIALEKLSAQPDQLLSYHLWAEDVGPDGKVRRTLGDMFFADVRPFEEIYRQGQQPAGGEQEQRQQQQQQQGQGQNGQNAQRAENAAESIKQIIAATWKVIRREDAEPLSALFVPDVKLLEDSLSAAKEQAGGMADQVADDRSKSYLQSAMDDIDKAIGQLKAGETGPSVKPLTPALAAEQAAYQDLLKLRAREFEVTRGRQQGQRGQSTASARRQQQMNQMDLENRDNPYQTQRNATPEQQQQQQDAQRETRQVLSRLRELAQRQEDLNRQMRELQSSLEAARDQAQREELQRQLARLRDQQQQQLRDTDELRDRMDQPQNQERMADARQQLEDTRNNVQRASQELQNGQVQQAAAAGQRASEQLNNLQDQVRRAAAGQFGEAMNQMRQDARQLEQNEQQLGQRLTELDKPGQPTPANPGLRDNAAGTQPAQQRQLIAQDLQQQRQQLQRLMDNMRQTVEEAETPEPLLSRQLYDTIRQAQQQAPDRSLDSTRELVQQGLLQEARQSETDAGRGITSMREGVEKAATSVLGDETESLRRARNELDALAQQLDREMGRAGAATRPAASQPAGERMLAGTQPASRPATRPGDAQLAQNDPNGRSGAAPRGDPQQGAPRGGQQGQQPGAQGERQLAGAGRGQPGDQAGDGAQPDNAGRGQQPGRDGQPGQQPGQGARQANAGRGGQRGQQPDGQPGGQPGDAQDQQLAQGRGAGLRQGQNGQPGGGRQGNQPGNRGGQPNQQGDNNQQGDQPGDAQLAQGDQPQAGRGGQQAGTRGGLRAAGNQGPQIARGGADNGGANSGGDDRGGIPTGDPITGDGYRAFADGLRDVEEMVGDPRLSAQAAQIRQRAAELRAEVRRHSAEPNWNIVQDTISKPLAELRNAVAQELLRRESSQALVPIDKEPVPPDYAEQVRRYYERLGSGK